MRSIRLLIALLVLVVVGGFVATFVLNDDTEWFGKHPTTTTLTADRPECPVTWSGTTIPVGKIPRLPGEPFSATTWQVPPGGLVVPGPITDIPEFHDCQKFIRPGGAAYDSLFAVFAAYKLDSITNALAFDAVAWSSSNAAVATVSATGKVTAVAAGSATIKALSADLLRQITVSATVVAGPPSAADTTITVMPGVGPLPTLHVGETVTLVPILGPATVSTLAVAEIYTFGDGYIPLGIGRNFSCLYVYFNASNQLVGKMVAYGTLGSGTDECAKAANPNVPSGRPETSLTVIRTVAKVKGEFPAAARWDYDPQNEQYYVGLKCGEGWCEVGASKKDRPFATSAALPVSSATPPEQLQVMRGKGWYDQQELAFERDGQSVPSGLIGTIVPVPGLVDIDYTEYKAGFKTVAYVGMRPKPGTTADPAAVKYYKAKFNYDPVPVGDVLTKLNKISICYGSRSHCGVPNKPGGILCGNKQDLYFWPSHLWVKIEPAGDGAAWYRCGIRRDHTGMQGVTIGMIPATTRWRWLAKDETVWDFCAAMGCCETAGDEISGGWR